MKSSHEKRKSSASSTTIAFRLEHEASKVLAERSKLFGCSVHELARRYVLEALTEDEERAALREAVGAMHQEIVALRQDLVFAVEALLVSAGKVEEGDAQAWVKENFNASHDPSFQS